MTEFLKKTKSMTDKLRHRVFLPLLVGFFCADFSLSVLNLLSSRNFYPLTPPLSNYVCILCMALDASILIYLLTGWRSAYLFSSLYMFFRAALLIIALSFFSPLVYLSASAFGRVASFLSVAFFVLLALFLLLFYLRIQEV